MHREENCAQSEEIESGNQNHIHAFQDGLQRHNVPTGHDPEEHAVETDIRTQHDKSDPDSLRNEPRYDGARTSENLAVTPPSAEKYVPPTEMLEEDSITNTESEHSDSPEHRGESSEPYDTGSDLEPSIHEDLGPGDTRSNDQIDQDPTLDFARLHYDLPRFERYCDRYDYSSDDFASLDIEGEQLPPYTRHVREPPPPFTPSRLKKTILAAKEKSSGYVELFQNVFTAVFCNAACYGAMIVFLVILPIVMISLGYREMKHCPRQKYIPIYLMVGGAFGIFKGIIHIVQLVREKSLAQEREAIGKPAPQRKISILDVIITLFLLAWFCAGCMWVYSIEDKYQWTDQQAPNYCDNSLYQFAFWLNTCVLVIMALICTCCCVLSVITYHCIRQDNDNNDDETPNRSVLDIDTPHDSVLLELTDISQTNDDT